MKYIQINTLYYFLLAGSGDILLKDEPKTSVENEAMLSVKLENMVEPQLFLIPNATETYQTPPHPHPSNIPSISSSVDVHPPPGEVSLMCSPRGWGRPRKIRPEVELHLRTVKNRRQRQSKSGGWNSGEVFALEAKNSKSGSKSEVLIKEHTNSRQMLPNESCNEDSLNPCASAFMPFNEETPLSTSPHLGPVTLPKVSAT